MSDQPFRVLLDLTGLFDDNLKYVWVSVNPLQLKTISDFKGSILQKLNLEKRDINIFVREGLLLDKETIIVLRENDTVKVQYKDLGSSAANLTKEKKKSLKKRNYSESINDVDLNPKRSKVDNVCDKKCDFVPEKKKSKKQGSSASTIHINSHTESLEENNHITEENSEKTNKKSNTMVESYVDDYCNINQNFENSGNSINSRSEIFEKNLSDVKKKQKKKDVSETSDFLLSIDDDTSKNCNTFVSFLDVDPTVKLLENASSSAITDTFSGDISKNSQNSNNFSDIDVKMSVETSKSNQKKKRKRRKKRKNTLLISPEVCENADATKFLSFSNDVDETGTEQKLNCVTMNVDPDVQNLNSFSNNEENLKRKHIVYSPVSHEVENNPMEFHNIKKMRNSNSSSNTYIVNEDTSAVNTQSFKDYPKVSTPNASNKCENLSWHVSLMQSTHSVTNNEPLISEKKCMKNIAKKKSFTQEKTSHMKCEDLPPLNSFPDIGTRIKYKTLELDESYSPVISEYREGLVKGVNHDTQEIEIELFKEVVKPGRVGKFENLKVDESPSPEIIKYDIVNWSSLVSPKRIN